MGLISKTLGLGQEFDFEGTPYTLPPWSYKIQGLYERYLEKEAVEAAKRMSAYLSPDQGRKVMQDVNRDITAGIYTFGGEEVALSFACIKHFTQLVFLMLQQEQPTIDRKLVERMVEADLEAMHDRIAGANADPTTPGTATTEIGPLPTAPATAVGT